MSGRWSAVVAAIVVGGGTAHAEREVTGRVLDAASGQPVVGALVAVGAGEAGSDDDGRFTIENLPFGRHDVVVIADGFRAYFGSARVGDELTIRIVPAVGEGELIRVSGRVPSGPPLHLDTTEIRNLPGAGNDALRALQSLPGVARTPFGLGGLALRGTAPRDTKVYLDGIEVPLLYHFGGIASFLPTAAVDELTLQPGGASVRYGRGLGGVATVTSRTGRGDRWRVGGEVSLIHAAAIAEGPGPARGSWLMGVRRSYFDAIQKAASLDLALVPRYGDAQLRWESGDGQWMAIAFVSDDKLRLVHDPNDASTGGINTSNVKAFTYTSRFARLGMRYRAVHGATQLTILPSVGIDDVNGRANHNDQDKGLHRWTVPLTLRAEVATPLFGGTLSFGLDGGGSRHAYDIINTPPPSPSDPTPDMVLRRSLTRWTADLGAWIEQSWFVANDKIEIRPGLRGDHIGLSDQWSLDPRIVIHEQLPHHIELTQSAGLYNEPPLITDLDPIFMREKPMLGSIAAQLAFGGKAIVADDNEVSATAYYQHLRQLPVDAVTGATPISANGGTDSGGALGISRELVDAQFGSYSYREAIGRGYAYGLELIARRNRGTWTGWVAYTYGRSLRQNPTRGPDYFAYVLDQPHTLTIVGTTALGKQWRAGGRFRYATGNPFTPIAGATMDADGDYIAIDGPILSSRLPSFFQLDLRLDRTWRRAWGILNLYLDIQNVTNRRNAEGVTYNEDYTVRSYTRGLPIFPSIGVEYIP
ncbi:MAG: TonB-dependent receptor [Deltaproteobacteria bacterium]|nr:TonB-dependent receptor [Deltaproteobacteria bacterium]